MQRVGLEVLAARAEQRDVAEGELAGLKAVLLSRAYEASNEIGSVALVLIQVDPEEMKRLTARIKRSLFRASDAQWFENSPGMAWTRVLWTGPESGQWAAVFRWKKASSKMIVHA